MGHWSIRQLNIAISSGEVELNAFVKYTSGVMGAMEPYQETYGNQPNANIRIDALACKGCYFFMGQEYRNT